MRYSVLLLSLIMLIGCKVRSNKPNTAFKVKGLYGVEDSIFSDKQHHFLEIIAHNSNPGLICVYGFTANDDEIPKSLRNISQNVSNTSPRQNLAFIKHKWELFSKIVREEKSYYFNRYPMEKAVISELGNVPSKTQRFIEADFNMTTPLVGLGCVATFGFASILFPPAAIAAGASVAVVVGYGALKILSLDEVISSKFESLEVENTTLKSLQSPKQTKVENAHIVKELHRSLKLLTKNRGYRQFDKGECLTPSQISDQFSKIAI